MPLTIEDLLTFSSMKDAELTAGHTGIHNSITNIVVMEALDISEWVKPGYLLLSSFFAMKDSPEEELVSIIKDLVNCSSAGLIIKTDRLVADIPAVMINACEQYGLPLMKIPQETAYSSIQMEVMQQLFNKKVALLDYFYEMHNRFTEFSLKQPVAPEVLGYLSEIIENPCAVMNSHKNIMYATDESFKNLKRLRKLEDEGDKILFNYEVSEVETADGGVFRQILIKIPLIDNTKQYYLVIIDKKGFISDKDYMAVENAVSFLQMLLVQRAAVFNLKQHHLNDIFDDLIGERFESQQYLDELVRKLRLKGEKGLFHVVTIYFFRPDNGDLKELLEEFADNIKLVWPGSAYRTRVNRLVLLLPAQNMGAEDVKKKFNEDVKSILKLISSEDIIYKAGISDPGVVSSLKKPNSQSRMIAKKILRNKKSFVANSADIGLYKFFTHISKDVDLIDLVPERLRFLKQEHKALFDTLKVYLDTNQHMKESANILSLHTKTIKYRIEKIIELTRINFNDPEEMLQYNIGFRILEIN